MNDFYNYFENKFPKRRELIDSILEDDESSSFPREAQKLIDEGILNYIIPQHLDGELKGIDHLFALGRCLARRNVTSAIAVGQCFLGSLPVWIHGSDEQKEELAAILKDGGLNCLALTELEHGSDLSASEVSVIEEGDKLVLNGQKWCINNATKGSAMSVLAKGELGPTLLFVNKAKLNGDYSNIDKLKTHGIKGADISGIVYSDTKLDKKSYIGKPGRGLETVARTMQISRTLCSAFSLGAADSTLRDTVNFSHSRVLYGELLKERGSVKSLTSKALANVLAAEALAISVNRMATLAPKFMALYSAVVKSFVPYLVEKQISICSEILGARYYLRENDYPLFQKNVRDHAVVSLFDGSMGVNLSIIAAKFNNIKKHIDVTDEYDYEEVYNLKYETLHFDGSTLKLSSRSYDFIFSAFNNLFEDDTRGVVLQLKTEVENLRTFIESVTDYTTYMARETALKYCRIMTALNYLVFVKYNSDKMLPELATDDSIQFVISTILDQPCDYQYSDELFSHYRDNHLFSHFDIEVNE
jgi:alkylation response protein AidB-like acyl-CoA dehydrogenase